MPNRLTNIRVRQVDFVDRAATRDPQNPHQPRRFLLWKSEESKGNSMATATVEELQEKLEKAEKDRDEAVAASAKKDEELSKAQEELSKRRIGSKGAKPADGNGPDDEDEEDEDELSKADLPEPVRAALAKAEGQVEELRKRAESAEEIAKAERHAREEREWIAKAEKDLPELGDPETVGKRLHKMQEVLTKEEFDEFQREQSALNEQLSTSDLFKQAGRGGPPPKSEGLPDILKKADELAASNPSLDPAEAFRRAAKDPEMVKAYARERTGA